MKLTIKKLRRWFATQVSQLGVDASYHWTHRDEQFASVHDWCVRVPSRARPTGGIEPPHSSSLTEELLLEKG